MTQFSWRWSLPLLLGCLLLCAAIGRAADTAAPETTPRVTLEYRFQPGEKIVFTWQVWPDKESFYAAEAKMHEDGRLDTSGEPPFDAKRLVLGCFQPVFSMGRDR